MYVSTLTGIALGINSITSSPPSVTLNLFVTSTSLYVYTAPVYAFEL